MYDVKPGSEGIPELAAHIAARRAETLAAIRRGILPEGGENAIADRLAARVLASLEQYWQDSSVFT